MDNQDFLTIIEAIKELKKEFAIVKDFFQDQSKNEYYTSSELAELFSALSKAQKEFPEIKPNKINPWFDTPYVDIATIAKTIYPFLGAHGLSITQQPRINDDGGTVLYTRLCHNSGQWFESRLRVIPPKNDIDSFRSTLNALRSTAILSMLGIGLSNDPFDDDGEVSMLEARQQFAKAPATKSVDMKKQDAQVITKEQREELEYEMGEYTDLAQEIMDRCHVRSLSDIPKSQFRNAITFIRKNKQAREGK